MRVKPVIRNFGTQYVGYPRDMGVVSEEKANDAMRVYYKCKSSLLSAENNGRMVLDGQYVSTVYAKTKMAEQIPIIDKYLLYTGQPTLAEMQASVNRRVGTDMNGMIQGGVYEFTRPDDNSYSYLNRYCNAPVQKVANICRGGNSKITMTEMLATQMMYEAVLKESQHTLAGRPFCVIDRHRMRPYEMDKIMAKQLVCLEVGENQHGIAQMCDPGSRKRQIMYLPGGRCLNPVDYELLGISSLNGKSKNPRRRLPSIADDFDSNQRQCGYGDFGE